MALDKEAHYEIETRVRAGFYSPERIIEIVCEELYEPGEVSPDEVEPVVRAVFRALEHEAAEWPDITDCDRLDAAFAAMRRERIIALQNAGYTQSDGYDDVLEEFANVRKKETILGYCFYHGQDLERAVWGDGLYLAFGPIDSKEEETKGSEVGRMVVEKLREAGLQTVWDGTFEKRILVTKLSWKRRRDFRVGV